MFLSIYSLWLSNGICIIIYLFILRHGRVIFILILFVLPIYFVRCPELYFPSGRFLIPQQILFLVLGHDAGPVSDRDCSFSFSHHSSLLHNPLFPSTHSPMHTFHSPLFPSILTYPFRTEVQVMTLHFCTCTFIPFCAGAWPAVLLVLMS